MYLFTTSTIWFDIEEFIEYQNNGDQITQNIEKIILKSSFPKLVQSEMEQRTAHGSKRTTEVKDFNVMYYYFTM